MTNRRGAGISARKIVAFLFEGDDERRAIKMRIDLGKIQWLLSWEAQNDGTWLARISAPGRSRTVARDGRTRVEAIERASRTLRHSIELRLKRGQIG